MKISILQKGMGFIIHNLISNTYPIKQGKHLNDSDNGETILALIRKNEKLPSIFRDFWFFKHKMTNLKPNTKLNTKELRELEVT